MTSRAPNVTAEQIQCYIMPRLELRNAYTKYRCKRVISIFESQEIGTLGEPTPEGVDPTQHDRHYFDDIFLEDCTETGKPSVEDAQRIIDSFATLPKSAESKIFVHCYAGVSRSSAVVYILYCMELGPDREVEAMELTEKSAPWGGIYPNSLLVKYADESMGRDGKMIKALRDWKVETQKRLKSGDYLID